MLSAILWTIMIVALLVSWWRNPARTRQGLLAGCRALKGMAPDVLGMIALIGLLIESSFLGLRFALLRLALTVPCVLAVGYLIEKLLPAGIVPETASQG